MAVSFWSLGVRPMLWLTVVMGSVPSGLSKVLWRTCLNTGVYMLDSVKIYTNSGERKGVWLACVNCRLASAKHISSKSAFDFEAWCLEGLSWVGPQTWLSPCWCPPFLIACAICHALFLVFSVVWIFFQIAFLDFFVAIAWAATRSASHLSHHPLLFFSLLYFLYPVQMWADTWSSDKSKFVGMWLMLPFFTIRTRYFVLMYPPLILFQTPFQYKILAIAWVSWGHHSTFPTVSFLHSCSAMSLAWVVTSLITSNCLCCTLVSMVPVMVFSNAFSRLRRFCDLSAFSNSLL